MSSYVINKKYYVRVAGYISGIAKELNVQVYNYTENRNFTEEDYYKLFCTLYDANAISVQKQYHDDTRETDSDDYMQDFNAYKKIGVKDVYNHDYKKILVNLNSFFSSCKYQIEQPTLEKFAVNTLNKIFVAIFDRTIGSDFNTECWGSFEVESESNITRIM